MACGSLVSRGRECAPSLLLRNVDNCLLAPPIPGAFADRARRSPLQQRAALPDYRERRPDGPGSRYQDWARSPEKVFWCIVGAASPSEITESLDRERRAGQIYRPEGRTGVQCNRLQAAWKRRPLSLDVSS
jgi:hypothetical protein